MKKIPDVIVQAHVKFCPKPRKLGMARVRAFADVKVKIGNIRFKILQIRVLTWDVQPFCADVLPPARQGYSTFEPAILLEGKLFRVVKDAVVAEFTRLQNA